MQIHNAILASALFACGGCASAGLPPAAEYVPGDVDAPAPEQPAQDEATTPAAGAEAPLCPADVPGTSVVATPLEDGAALLFVGPRDAEHVAELRRRVRALARTQNRAAFRPPGDPRPSAVRAAVEAGRPREPTATVSDIERGAMLRFEPSEFDQLTDVQANVMEYAQRLAGGDCPLTRDELSLLPAERGRTGTEPNVVPMPSGIIPGAGAGMQSPTTMPSLGVWF